MLRNSSCACPSLVAAASSQLDGGVIKDMLMPEVLWHGRVALHCSSSCRIHPFGMPTQEEERAALAAEKAAAVDEVDQWCTGEVEAVRHVAQKEVEQAKAAVQEWCVCDRPGSGFTCCRLDAGIVLGTIGMHIRVTWCVCNCASLCCIGAGSRGSRRRQTSAGAQRKKQGKLPPALTRYILLCCSAHTLLLRTRACCEHMTALQHPTQSTHPDTTSNSASVNSAGVAGHDVRACVRRQRKRC